jgi:hypothetical protein
MRPNFAAAHPSFYEHAPFQNEQRAARRCAVGEHIRRAEYRRKKPTRPHTPPFPAAHTSVCLSPLAAQPHCAQNPLSSTTPPLQKHTAPQNSGKIERGTHLALRWWRFATWCDRGAARPRAFDLIGDVERVAWQVRSPFSVYLHQEFDDQICTVWVVARKLCDVSEQTKQEKAVECRW